MRKTLFGLCLGLSLVVFAATVNVNDTTVYQALFRPWTRTTTQLPTASAYLGYVAYDTTLSRLSVSDGTAWRPLAQSTGGDTLSSLGVGPGPISGDGGLTLVGTASPLRVGPSGISTDGGLTVASSALTVTGAGSSATITSLTATTANLTTTSATTLSIGSGTALTASESGSIFWDMPSLGGGGVNAVCGVTGQIVVPGAVITDKCSASSNFGVDGGAGIVDDAQLTCLVTSAGLAKAKLCFYVVDGGAYDLGDGGYSVRTWR